MLSTIKCTKFVCYCGILNDGGFTNTYILAIDFGISCAFMPESLHICIDCNIGTVRMSKTNN